MGTSGSCYWSCFASYCLGMKVSLMECLLPKYQFKRSWQNSKVSPGREFLMNDFIREVWQGKVGMFSIREWPLKQKSQKGTGMDKRALAMKRNTCPLDCSPPKHASPLLCSSTTDSWNKLKIRLLLQSSHGFISWLTIWPNSFFVFF